MSSQHKIEKKKLENVQLQPTEVQSSNVSTALRNCSSPTFILAIGSGKKKSRLHVFCDRLYLGGAVFCIICMQFTDPGDSVSSWTTAWLGSRPWPDCKLHSAGNRPLKHTTLVSHVARSLCSWLRSVLLFSVPHSCYFLSSALKAWCHKLNIAYRL